jgi:hypothetical protein
VGQVRDVVLALELAVGAGERALEIPFVAQHLARFARRLFELLLERL